MRDEVVILGCVGIVGLVAVVSIALVYGRTFGFRGRAKSVEIQVNEKTSELIEPPKILELSSGDSASSDVASEDNPNGVTR